MTVRHNASSDHFDLLPFIAILMCLLGSLLLITMSMAAINIGPVQGWIPSKDVNETTKTPLLVEWDGQTMTIQYPAGFKQIYLGREYMDWFDSDVNFKSPEMLDFLKEMKDCNSTSYVLFAVRPSGFGNFQILANKFTTKKIDIGYEPIDQGKPVRLKTQQKDKL